MLVIAPWFLAAGIASVGFLLSLPQKGTLRMPRVFLAFSAAGSFTLFAVCLLWPSSYRTAYWAFDFASNLLLCCLSVELNWALLPRPFVQRWIRLAMILSGMMLVLRLPQVLVEPLVIISRAASVSGAILLLSLFLVSANWTAEHRIATAGVFAVLAGELLSFIESCCHTGPGQIWTAQVSPLLGLMLLSLAACSKNTAPSAS